MPPLWLLGQPAAAVTVDVDALVVAAAAVDADPAVAGRGSHDAAIVRLLLLMMTMLTAWR